MLKINSSGNKRTTGVTSEDHFQVRLIQDGAPSEHTIDVFSPGEGEVFFSVGGVAAETIWILSRSRMGRLFQASRWMAAAIPSTKTRSR